MVPSLNKIRAFFTKNSDEVLAKKYARFFTEGYDAYGIDKDLYLQQRDAWVKAVDWTKERAKVLALCDKLVASGKYEEGSMAIGFSRGMLDIMTKAEFDHIASWYDDGGLRNWAHVDIFCGEISGSFIERNNMPLTAIADWRQSSSKWKRRAAAVTCVSLIGKRSASELMEFVEPLLNDPEKPVQQGAGWLLKDIWKVSPQEMEAFLLPRVQDSGTITLQIAREKMPKEKKELYKKKRK